MIQEKHFLNFCFKKCSLRPCSLCKSNKMWLQKNVTDTERYFLKQENVTKMVGQVCPCFGETHICMLHICGRLIAAHTSRFPSPLIMPSYSDCGLTLANRTEANIIQARTWKSSYILGLAALGALQKSCEPN